MLKLSRQINKVEVAPHLLLKELQDPTTKQVMVDPKLIKAWTIFRKLLGRPFHITSGYRTRKTNTRVKGHRDSGHMKGKCIDGWVYIVGDFWVRNYAKRAGFTRIKKYKRRGHWHLGV